MFACLYRPPQSDTFTARRPTGTAPDISGDAGATPASRAQTVAAGIVAVARDCSPRYETHGPDLVVVDVAGLERLLGPPYVIGDELRRMAIDRGIRAHVAVASTQTAAMILARVRPGLTVIERGAEAAALAPIGIDALSSGLPSSVVPTSLQTSDVRLQTFETFQRWGVKTLGELAALPAADLVSRLGRAALAWQAMARGEDCRPLIPTLDEERFESTLDLEWPIEGLEPLSFVLTRLLEPLSTRLERRDRGAAVLHVLLDLVTRERVARRLELPTPMREVRALRTLALLDLESHPPPAAIDRVTLVIDPTPGRVLQHTLYTRAQPAPEQIATLVARLVAVMGQDRVGAAATVDTYRPGAFEMKPFPTLHAAQGRGDRYSEVPVAADPDARDRTSAVIPFRHALRRCRQPVPARVAVADGRPVRVTTDRRGFTGGAVVQAAGPWRTSGNWWSGSNWSRDEWDVSLSDGSVYRVFLDLEAEHWFIEAIVD